VLVIILILALAGGAYVILSNWSSAKAELATVPGVVGLSETDAKARVTAAGFGYKNEGTQASADVAPGSVARQDPAENMQLEKGKVIGVWISSGAGQVEVPNVVGLTEVAAGAKIGAAGLQVASKQEVNPNQPVGTVLRQNPEATQKVDAGTTVTITVAAAANTVTVPLLTQMNQAAAVATLNSMGLVANVQAIASQLPGGTVVDQNPKPGTDVQPGASITVYISNAPAPTTVKVPAVAAIGLSEAQAKAKLSQFGLKANVINLETPDFKPGVCIYQDPAAGVEVKIGSVVGITIARVPTTTTTTAPPTTTTTTAPPTTDTTAPPAT
jgi:serine/threonine-protein kinase